MHCHRNSVIRFRRLWIDLEALVQGLSERGAAASASHEQALHGACSRAAWRTTSVAEHATGGAKAPRVAWTCRDLCRRFCGIPGVGPVVALTFKAAAATSGGKRRFKGFAVSPSITPLNVARRAKLALLA